MKKYLLTLGAMLVMATGNLVAQTPTQPIDSQIVIEEQPATLAMPDSQNLQATIQPVVTEAPQQPLPPSEPPRRGLDFHWILDLVLLVLAAGALALALINRRELTNLQHTVADHADTTTRNLEKLARVTNEQFKALKNTALNEKRQTDIQPVTVTVTATPPANAPSPAKPAGPQTLYLARTDENGRFTRASETFELGNTIYVLTTTDGQRGTFKVMDNRDVHRFALMMPTENLTRACIGNNIQLSSGFSRIVTDRDGEAVREQGQWQVTKQAAIHYE